jgi:hypothetical protein
MYCSIEKCLEGFKDYIYYKYKCQTLITVAKKQEKLQVKEF